MLCLSPLLSLLSPLPHRSYILPAAFAQPVHSSHFHSHTIKSLFHRCACLHSPPSSMINLLCGRVTMAWRLGRLQRVTAPAQNHRWERSPASFFEQCRQCNAMAMQLCSAIGSAIGENCLHPILFSLLFPLFSPSPFSSPPTPLLICPHAYPYPPKTVFLPFDPH